MDGWIAIFMDGWMEMNGWIDRWIVRWMEGHIFESLDGWTSLG
jgi:hypothetical protein